MNDMNDMIDYEKLKFIAEELQKNYIPTDCVKLEFFARFFPDIQEDEIKYYKVIMSNTLRDKFYENGKGVSSQTMDDLNDWLIFDRNVPDDTIMVARTRTEDFMGLKFDGFYREKDKK